MLRNFTMRDHTLYFLYRNVNNCPIFWYFRFTHETLWGNCIAKKDNFPFLLIIFHCWTMMSFFGSFLQCGYNQTRLLCPCLSVLKDSNDVLMIGIIKFTVSLLLYSTRNRFAYRAKSFCYSKWKDKFWSRFVVRFQIDFVIFSVYCFLYF